MQEDENRVGDAYDAGGNHVARMRDLMDALVKLVVASGKPTEDAGYAKNTNQQVHAVPLDVGMRIEYIIKQ